jgi:cardiolipin synthase A/B
VIMDEVSTLGAGNAPPAGAMPPGFVMPASMWRYLERGSNVAARAFLNPWMSSDHSKVFIFDKRYAHLGGMNIGREYRYEWHDMMVELEGPVVGRFAGDFERSWAFASALGDLAYVVAAVATRNEFAGERERADYVDVRPLYTHTGNPEIYDAMTGAVKRASSYVWVENPYLYENSFVRALVGARRRGVDVRVVLPSDSDLGLGNASNKVTANALIANGVRVYVYPGMTHVKAAIVDGWACLGSANFNKLSLRRNIETNIATSAPGVVGQLRRDLFEVDFAASAELSEPVATDGSDKFAEFVMDQF